LTNNIYAYQREARKTAIYPDQGELQGLLYAALGLANEAGEVAGEVKKILRDDDGELTDERYAKLVSELGDVLWYAAQVASEIGVPLNLVTERNLAKLASRAERGVLGGSGGDR